MTEEEWLTTVDVEGALAHLRTTVSLRKARLFGVACCRRVIHLNFAAEVPHALDAVEAFADGSANVEELSQAHDAVYNAREFAGRAYMGDPDDPTPNDGTAAYFVLDGVIDLFNHIGSKLGSPARQSREAIWFADRTPERKGNVAEAIAQAALLRDIFGNPFRPVAFDPAWRTDTAVSLARGMYDSRDFGAMPILADALQDAGCEDEQVLHHCRDATAPHVRGCWVCDLVLGKA